MPPITKNLGLVKAIHVGVNPPINKVILWYNTNPGQNIHYYWNLVSLMWVPLAGPGAGPINIDKTIYVSPLYGNDGTGTRESLSKPFFTVAAAVLAAQDFDTIVLLPGDHVNLISNFYNVANNTLYVHILNHARLIQFVTINIPSGYNLVFFGEGEINCISGTILFNLLAFNNNSLIVDIDTINSNGQVVQALGGNVSFKARNVFTTGSAFFFNNWIGLKSDIEIGKLDCLSGNSTFVIIYNNDGNYRQFNCNIKHINADAIVSGMFYIDGGDNDLNHIYINVDDGQLISVGATAYNCILYVSRTHNTIHLNGNYVSNGFGIVMANGVGFGDGSFETIHFNGILNSKNGNFIGEKCKLFADGLLISDTTSPNATVNVGFTTIGHIDNKGGYFYLKSGGVKSLDASSNAIYMGSILANDINTICILSGVLQTQGVNETINALNHQTILNIGSGINNPTNFSNIANSGTFFQDSNFSI